MKTKTSNHTLPIIPEIEEALLKHKAKIEKNKEFFGSTYDTRYLDYVCVRPDGRIYYPDFMTKAFADLINMHGLKHIRLHDLRHSCASNMLASGVQMKEIQEWLGHSNFSTTADVYSHLDFSSKVKAANKIANAYTVKNENTGSTEEITLKSFAKAIEEMQNLGIDNVNEYLDYLTEQDKKQKSKKDMQM